MAPRCKEYLWEGTPETEIFSIQEGLYSLYSQEVWKDQPYEIMCYVEFGFQFNRFLLHNTGMKLHSSAVKWNEKAFLFSADSGTGKSTHRKMWQQLYGEDAVKVINDDKPALRLFDDKWYVFGTPWCGKDGINKNIKVPLGGICFLERGPENRIRKLTPLEAVPRLINQTVLTEDKDEMNLLLDSLDKLIRKIPIYLLECTPTTDAAKLSSETMLQGAIEAGL